MVTWCYLLKELIIALKRFPLIHVEKSAGKMDFQSLDLHKSF